MTCKLRADVTNKQYMDYRSNEVTESYLGPNKEIGLELDIKSLLDESNVAGFFSKLENTNQLEPEEQRTLANKLDEHIDIIEVPVDVKETIKKTIHWLKYWANKGADVELVK